ncbi:hypothetical protein ACTXT7_004508 [Hymenolepis weldensis]
MTMKILNHPILAFENFMGWSQILLEDIGGSSSIGYAVYPKRLNNNGLKSLHIGDCIYIDSKALWKKCGSHDVLFTALHNIENRHCWWKHRAYE